jgi:hypothetical protein
MKYYSVIIMNPPYKKGLHLKFLNLATVLSKQYIISIQPIPFLLTRKLYKVYNYYQQTKENIRSILYKLKIINGNYYFNAGFFTPVGILYLDKNKTDSLITVTNELSQNTYNINSIDDINLFDNHPLYLSIKDKIWSYPHKLNDYVRKQNFQYPYYINIARIRGNIKNEKHNMYSHTFYTYLPEKEKPTKTPDKQPLEFNTEQEAQNFLDSLKTNFMRFALKIIKYNQNMERAELKSIPYMIDYTRIWTDSDLYSFFKLTLSEVKYIEENI